MRLDDYERLPKDFLAKRHCNTIIYGGGGGGKLRQLKNVKIFQI